LGATVKAKQVSIKRSVIESILDYAKACYPKEGILLLRGKTRKDRIIVEDVEIPPLSVRGSGFSSFPRYMLPIDFSVVGTMHSHPSGALRPSTADMNHFYGRIMIIVAYPYRSEQDIIVLDREGNAANYEIV
jgi:proteasome lid subunit RPN8/RPN11